MVTSWCEALNVTPLTALDLVGITVRRMSGWAYRHACPRCGSDAWAGRHVSQCVSRHCTAQVMAPLDIVAEHHQGDYVEADRIASAALRQPADPEAAARRAVERRVLDFWLRSCLAPRSCESERVAQRMDRDGRSQNASTFSVTILGKEQIAELIKLAMATGAELPVGWQDDPPPPSAAYCVQTNPFTIDRIVLLRRGESSVIWRKVRSGFTGLIGLQPERPRFLAPSIQAALTLQTGLAKVGHYEEVAATFLDQWCSPVEDPWRPEVHLLTAVPDDDEDIVSMQQSLDSFPDVEKHLHATPRDVVLKSGFGCRDTSWDALRVAHILSSIGSRDTAVPPYAARLYERTGARLQDASKIINQLRSNGRIAVAEDFHRLTENRVIFKDHKVEVRESVDEYYILTHAGRSQVANFTLKLSGNVRFRDRSDTYCMGALRCGTLRREVVFKHSLLSGKAARLQEDLHNHLVTPGEAVALAQIPTIIDTSQFQKYVIPTLNQQLATLPMIEGISRLGWASDRKTFHAPGVTVSADGRTEVPAVFYPGVHTLRAFGPVDTWASVCPANLHPACQDIISIMLALTVRYYRRCATPPLCVLQTSDAVAVLEGMVKLLGQHSIMDMGVNVRDVANVDGVNGYPFLTSGYGKAQLSKSNLPYIVITDEGYRIDGSPDPAQIEAGGRALQYALLRVAEWCLATGADDFHESPSVTHHVSLMREGQWLVRNVCDLQPWEISVQGLLGMEYMLSQIPVANTKDRMTLKDGHLLTIDLAGIEWDAIQVAEEAASFGASIEVDGDHLSAPAAALLPAMARFYGAAPDVSLA